MKNSDFYQNYKKNVVPKIMADLGYQNYLQVPKILKIVRDGLVGVVSDPRGTGHRAKLSEEFAIGTAGKTGTAQVISMGLGTGEHHEDHAWFAGYAPTDKPEIAVVALVENGGHGGVAAAPKVRQVMEAYFRDRRKEVDVNAATKSDKVSVGEDAD